MSESSYLEYHQMLVDQLLDAVLHSAPFNGGELDELQAQFLDKVKNLAPGDQDNTLSPEARTELGQWILCRIVAEYPHLMPRVPRDLFWYFGGDCLHYMSDEEIRFFQSIDEAFHEAQASNEGDIDYAELLAAATSPRPAGKPH